MRVEKSAPSRSVDKGVEERRCISTGLKRMQNDRQAAWRKSAEPLDRIEVALSRIQQCKICRTCRELCRGVGRNRRIDQEASPVSPINRTEQGSDNSGAFVGYGEGL